MPLLAHMEVFAPLIPEYSPSQRHRLRQSSGGLEGFIMSGDTSCGGAVNSFGASRIFEEAAAPVSFIRER